MLGSNVFAVFGTAASISTEQHQLNRGHDDAGY